MRRLTRGDVLYLLRRMGADGATADEIAANLADTKRNVAAAHLHALVKIGKAAKAGMRGGRTVYVAARHVRGPEDA